MTKISIKRKNSGGLRTRRKLTWGTQRLIKALWEKHGGTHELARQFGVLPQSLINWRNMGKVPLVQAGKFARLLDIPIESLNYKDFGIFSGSNSSWKEVVENCSLTPDIADKVLTGKEPAPFKED